MRTAGVSFLLDGQIRHVENVDPTQSILSWLRYNERRTGSKEGCAEGDCGACTVVIGTLAGDRVVYRAHNACIAFMPMLDGKELVTVESLGGGSGLHPVQKAMADADGSQCGFCTPGFVMSLFALHLRSDPALPASVEDVIAGNLCRCTGYGPILKAASHANERAAGGKKFGGPSTISALRSLQRTSSLGMEWTDPVLQQTRKYFAPTTREELGALVAEHPEAVILAGGTDVGLWVSKQHRHLETIISVNDVVGLADVCETRDAIEIGAGVRYSDAWALLAQTFPDLGELIRRIGSVQVRNSGTIGGNIANGSPIGDTPPALIALGAKLVISAATGERIIRLEDYFIDYGSQDLQPGEYVSKVIIPKPRKNDMFRAYKLSKRFDQDISSVSGAFSLTVDSGIVERARIAFGGMAATPKRARECESVLTGAVWSKESFAGAAQALAKDFVPITDVRASDAYRLKSAQNLLLKVFAEHEGPSAATRLVGWR